MKSDESTGNPFEEFISALSSLGFVEVRGLPRDGRGDRVFQYDEKKSSVTHYVACTRKYHVAKGFEPRHLVTTHAAHAALGTLGRRVLDRVETDRRPFSPAFFFWMPCLGHRLLDVLSKHARAVALPVEGSVEPWRSAIDELVQGRIDGYIREFRSAADIYERLRSNAGEYIWVWHGPLWMACKLVVYGTLAGIEPDTLRREVEYARPDLTPPVIGAAVDVDGLLEYIVSAGIQCASQLRPN